MTTSIPEAPARGTSSALGFRLGASSRRISATAFACTALAFTLPFGTVSSCDGEEVTFTGAELATFTVPPDESTSSGTLHTEIERNGGALALVVLLAAVLGFVAALARKRRGGICASLGLVVAQLLGMAILLTGTAGGMVDAGYGLALLSLAVAGVVHLVAALRARRRSGRRVWSYAVGQCCLALSPSLAVVLLIAIAVLSGSA
jgi:hypothetical protein